MTCVELERTIDRGSVVEYRQQLLSQPTSKRLHFYVVAVGGASHSFIERQRDVPGYK